MKSSKRIKRAGELHMKGDDFGHGGLIAEKQAYGVEKRRRIGGGKWGPKIKKFKKKKREIKTYGAWHVSLLHGA